MKEHVWDRCEPDDPKRCQAVRHNAGQCINRAVEGSQYCPVHGGNKAVELAAAQNLRSYRLVKYKARHDQFTTDPGIKSLREEIGILRILVEERMNLCQTDTDLLLHSAPLSDLIMKVEKLVSSCNRLEGQLGVMLDKTQALQFATEVIDIIGRYVENEETLSQIADEIIGSIKAG